jgi:hypothetical protein
MSDNMEKSDDTQAAFRGFDLQEVKHVVCLLWKGRLVIALTTVLAVFLAIIYLHIASYTYSTTLTLIPTQSQPREMTGQLGGLAAMAGINLAAGANTLSPFSIYPEAAQTRQVAVGILQDWPELPQLIFSDQWDARAQTWHPPQSFKLSLIRFVKPFFGIPNYPWRQPGAAELQQYIAQGVGIAEDKKKSMYTVTVQSADPDFSMKLLRALHRATDRELRRITLDRAQRYAAYLRNKLTTEQSSVIRDVLMQSLSEQETLIMMGSSSTDFAAQPLAPPESSTRPTSPIPVYVLLIAIMLGVFAGSGLVMFGFKLPGRRFRSAT